MARSTDRTRRWLDPAFQAKVRTRARRTGLVWGVIVSALAAWFSVSGLPQMVRHDMYDAFVQLRGTEPLDNKMLLILFDDATVDALQSLGESTLPISRHHYATLMCFLCESGARAVAFDFIFDAQTQGCSPRSLAQDSCRVCNLSESRLESCQSGDGGSERVQTDSLLSAALQLIPNTVIGANLERRARNLDAEGGTQLVETRESLPDALFQNSASLGLINLPTDSDGFIRRYGVQSGEIDTFAVAVAKLVEPERFQSESETIRLDGEPIDLDRFNRFPIRFAGPAGTVPSVSYGSMLQPLILRREAALFEDTTDEFAQLIAEETRALDEIAELVEDAIVLVGPATRAEQDFKLTPFFGFDRGQFREMTGVEVHAHALHTLLSGPPYQIPENGVRIAAILVLMLGLTLAAVWLPVAPSVGLNVVAIFASLGLGAALLANGIIWLPVEEVIGLVAFSLTFYPLRYVLDINIKNREISAFSMHLEDLVDERTRDLHDAQRELAKQYDVISERNRLIEEDLQLARRVQRETIATTPARIPGLSVASVYRPMEAVGGDFFDFHLNDEGHLSVFLSDVSGHGVSAAFITSMIKIQLSAMVQSEQSHTPEAVLRALNPTLMNYAAGNFVTAVYGQILPGAKRFRYATAGHVPTIRVRKQNGVVTIKALEPGGKPLGIFHDAHVRAFDVELEAGDRLVLYTDGLTEAMNQEDQYFEDVLLEKVLTDTAEDSPQATIDALMKALADFTHRVAFEDDVAIVVIDLRDEVVVI